MEIEDFKDLYKDRIKAYKAEENQALGFEETYPTSSGRFLTKDQILPEAKKLHKDTDLGYFAGVAMQSILLSDSYKSASARTKAENAVFLAKELIKQLDQEAK